MRAVKIVVSGRVQGVGFRAFVQRQAAAAAVTGWVRNLPDGSVECEAHGRVAVLEGFVEMLRSGPRHARIESAAVQWFESAEVPDGFRVTG